MIGHQDTGVTGAPVAKPTEAAPLIISGCYGFTVTFGTYEEYLQFRRGQKLVLLPGMLVTAFVVALLYLV
jgi:hypothetical protein